MNVAGFRKGHSTPTVLLRVRDDIIRAMKNGEITLIAFADFSKAFDTVDFQVVLKKLHAIGFSHSSFNWVLNYLTCRRQLVQVNDKQAEAVIYCLAFRRGRSWAQCFLIFMLTTIEITSPVIVSIC